MYKIKVSCVFIGVFLATIIFNLLRLLQNHILTTNVTYQRLNDDFSKQNLVTIVTKSCHLVVIFAATLLVCYDKLTYCFEKSTFCYEMLRKSAKSR